MRYAETGFNLEIDLSRGDIKRVETDFGLTEVYLGGLGTNAKIIWDRVSPEVEPFSPDNLLIFSAGLLVGTSAPSLNRTIISTGVSPQTLYMGFSIMGGFWAPELKQTGYDNIIISGKSPEWVYLWINNDRVEIRKASHLLGKSTYETAESIREELKEPKAQILSIGLAGENRVYFASVETYRGSASRLGIGAIMGDKRLKAIAVRGTKDLNIARPAEFMKLCDEILKVIDHRRNNPVKGVPPILSNIGIKEMELHDEQWHTTNFAWGHARVRRKDFWTREVEKRWTEVLESSRKRLISCYNCPNRCAGILQLPGFPTYVMKCYSKLTYTMAAMVDDLDFGLKIAARAQHYGVDGFTTPQVMAFAIELFENGILTQNEMEGIPSDKEGRFFWLLDRIVRREGIGDVLANGVYWAARQIGRGAEAYDHNTTKRHEQMVIKLGVLNPLYYLMYATGEKGNITQIEGQIPQAPLPTKELREEFVRDWIQMPSGKEERFKEFILQWGDPGTEFPFYPPIDLVCELVEWQEIMHYIDDALGTCTLVSSFALKPPYHIHNLPSLISLATGMEMDEDKLWEIATRNRNLVRAINIRRGLRRRDERPPEDHWKKRFPEYEEKLLDEYYKFRGWNKEGIPTEKTLNKLGLDYVSKDLKMRKILKDNEENSS